MNEALAIINDIRRAIDRTERIINDKETSEENRNWFIRMRQHHFATMIELQLAIYKHG